MFQCFIQRSYLATMVTRLWETGPWSDDVILDVINTVERFVASNPCLLSNNNVC